METALAFALGIGVCIALFCMFRSGKIASLQKELSQANQRCENCDYYRRMLAAEDELQSAKADRLKLYKSNSELRRDNKQLYHKVWRDA